MKIKQALLVGLPIILIVGCFKMCNTPTPEEKTKSTTRLVNKTIPPKTILQNLIKGCTDDINFKEYKDGKDFTLFAGVYNIYAETINENKNSTDPDITKLVNTLTIKVKANQIKTFPKARKEYASVLNDKLWENNVNVQVGGVNNTTITFTGVAFANNKNIKEMQETLGSMFNLLRFKEVRYRWIKYADEYTYFKIESMPDSKIELVNLAE